MKLAGALASLLCLLKPLLSVRGYLFEISSSGALVVLLYLPGTVLDGSRPYQLVFLCPLLSFSIDYVHRTHTLTPAEAQAHGLENAR